VDSSSRGLHLTFSDIEQALSLQEYIPDVAVLYSVDWLLGMIRTATNIWGDACACVIVDTWARRHAKNHGTLPIKVSPENMHESVNVAVIPKSFTCNSHGHNV
jgi:hypothetical protein